VLLTSAVAAMLGVAGTRLNWASLGTAGLLALEMLGTGALFFATNLVIGLIVIAMARVLMGWFVSPYILGDVSLLALSMLEGIVFASWYAVSKNANEAGR
jgi:hypothetical protein